MAGDAALFAPPRASRGWFGLISQKAKYALRALVALVRVPKETGLVPRFVPGVTVGGFDPAANYRRFPEQIERLETRYSN